MCTSARASLPIWVHDGGPHSAPRLYCANSLASGRFTLMMMSGAFSASALTAAGATVSADALKDADIIIKVKRPEASELAQYKRGVLVVAIMDPYGNETALKCRHRQSALLPRQHHDAARRRQEGDREHRQGDVGGFDSGAHLTGANNSSGGCCKLLQEEGQIYQRREPEITSICVCRFEQRCQALWVRNSWPALP